MRITQARSTVFMAVGLFSVGVGGLFAVDRVCLDLVDNGLVVQDTMNDNADEDDHLC